MSKVTTFDRLFNRCIDDENGYTYYGRSFVSRKDVDYLLELAEAYSTADNVLCVKKLRAVLKALDHCPSVAALARHFHLTRSGLDQRIRFYWRQVRNRCRSAVHFAEIGHGFVQHPIKWLPNVYEKQRSGRAVVA